MRTPSRAPSPTVPPLPAALVGLGGSEEVAELREWAAPGSGHLPKLGVRVLAWPMPSVNNARHKDLGDLTKHAILTAKVIGTI